MRLLTTNQNTIVKRITVGTPIKSVAQSGSNLNILGDDSASAVDIITTGSSEVLQFNGDGTISTHTAENESTVTFSIRNATYDDVGVAKFDSNQFTVVDGSVTINNFDSNNQITTDLIPIENEAYDLGSATNKWRSLYISGNTIFLGDIKVEDVDGTFTVKDSDGNIAPINLGAITTDDVAEGSTNLYYLTSRFDSDLLSGTSTSTIRSYLSAGTGAYYDNATGVISIGQSVDSSSNVTFNNITVNDVTANNTIILGNLTVQGTTTTVNSTEVSLNDKNLVLADSATSSELIDGGGITLGGTDYVGNSPSIIYSHLDTRWEMNIPLTVEGDVTTTTVNTQYVIADSGTIANLAGTNLRYDSAEITNIKSDSAEISSLSSNTILSVTGNISTANIGIANIDSAVIADINATNIDTEILASTSGNIINLISDSGDFRNLSVQTLISDDATFDSASIGNISSNYFNLVNGMIGSVSITTANIDTVSADSGTITDLGVTNLVSTTAVIDSATITNLNSTGSFYLGTGTVDGISGDSANFTNLSRSGATSYAGTWGTASNIPVITLNSSGFVDSIGTVSVAGVTDFAYDSSNGQLTISTADGNQFITTVTLDPFSTSTLAEGSNLYYTASRVDSDFDARLAIKSTDNLAEGSNLYYTTARADSDFDVRLTTKSTTDLVEGNNLYYTTARADSDAKNSVSATDAGGDGSFSYNSGTGVFTYTGPNATEVRAHFSGGTGVSITDGVVSIGQPVATTDSARFAELSTAGDIIVGGDLIVQGTTTTVNSTEISIADKSINIASNATNNTLANGAGISVGDSSSYAGAKIEYDGVSDRWDFNRNIEVDTVYAKVISDSSSITNLATINAIIDSAHVKLLSADNLAAALANIDSASIGDIALLTANIESANIDSATITSIAVNSANIALANIDSATVTNIAISDANISTANVDSATVTNIAINDANIAAGNIDSATITNIAINDANIETAVVDSATITNIAINDANIVAANIDSATVTNIAISDANIETAHIDSATVHNIASNTALILQANVDSATISHLASPEFNLGTGIVDSAVIAGLSGTTANFTNIIRSGATDYSGTFGSASLVPVITVDSSGFIDSIGTVSVAGVDSASWNSATSTYTINTADGGVYSTVINAFDSATITNLVGTTFNLGTGIVDSATITNVAIFNANVDSAYVKNLSADNLEIIAANIDSATITNLTGTTFNLGTGIVDSAVIAGLSGTTANFTNLIRSGATSYAGTWGSASAVPVITVNASGFVDSIGSVSVAGVTGFTYDSSNGNLTITTADGGSFTDNINFSPFTTSDLTEGNNLYYTTARADSDFDTRLTTKTTSNLTEGSNLYYTTDRADSDFDTRLTTKTTSDLTEGDNLYYTTARADSDFDTRLATKSTDNLAEGNNLYYTTARADSDFDVRLATKTTDNLTEGDNLYYTTARADSDFDVRLVTKSTDNLTEGDNLYYTTARADSDFDTRLTTKTTSDLGEGVNLYYTTDRADSDAKNAISVTDAGGDGSLSYNNLTGTITYTGPSASEARAHFSGGTGVSITDGVVAIGQPVATTSDVTFNNISADGYVDFKHDSATSPAHSEGRVYYSQEYKTLTVLNDISDVALQVGREEWMRGYNNTGSTITNGTPVYITGANGETPTIAPADASVEAQAYVIGVATNDILDASEGEVTTFGLVSGINTSNLVSGGLVHLAPGGGLQQNAATYPYYPTEIGTCITSDSSDGYLLVTVRHHTFERFRVTGNQFIGGDLTVNGNLTVSGTQSVVNQANLAVDTAFIYSNSGNTISTPTFTGSGLNDIVFVGHYNGTTSKTYYVRIDGVGTGTGGADTFEWSYDNFSTTEATGLDCTTTPFELEDNIKIDFNSTTGHTLNDAWSGAVAPVNVDAGFASNRNTGTSGVGYTHMGAFFDVTDEKWKFFKSYRPEPEGTIDTTDSSYQKATIDADLTGNVTGNLTGNVTGNASTATALATSRNFSASGDASASAVGFTGVANVDLVLTLATVNANVGTFGSGTQVPVITVNGKGLITSVTTSTIAGVTGVTYDSSNGDLTISTTGGDFTDNINLNPFSTTDLAEGNNLYYTTDRADSDFDTRLATKTTTDLGEGNNLYYTTARADSDFDTRLTTKTTSDLTEGDNLYYTTARFDSDFGENTTDDLTEGSTNLYYTQARADSDAKNAISVTDAGGDGSLSYNPTTGEITYTGPSASEVRAHFSASGDLSYSSETGIFSFSETYSTANELLTAIKTVDGAASGLDADLLDGQHGSYYRIDVYDATGTLLN